MKIARVLFLAALSFCGLTGCETTGDPNSGGIFWSESKAQDRLRRREDTLDDIQSDTRRVGSQNRRLESAAERKERALGY